MKAGWEVKPLGEVCNLQNGFAFKSKLFKPEGVPVLRISSIKDGCVNDNRPVFTDPNDYSQDLTRYEIKQGDLLIAMSGATTGKIGFNYSDKTFLLNQRVGKFEPSELLDINFLYYFLSTKVEENLEISAGAAQPNLSTRQIKEFALPFPPLEEQKRIVAILDEAFAGLDRARAHTEANLQNARDLFESLLLGFQLKGDETWSEDELQTVVQTDCSLSYGIVQPGTFVEGGLPVVRPTDMGKKSIEFSDLKLIDPANAEKYQRTILTGNELLLCVRGTTGMVSVTSQELAGANLTRGIVPVRFDESKVLQEFGYYLFLSSPIQKQIRSATYGAALQQINIRDVRKLIVAFPKISSQQKILIKLDKAAKKCAELENKYSAALTDLDDLRQSLLQKAFAGELT